MSQFLWYGLVNFGGVLGPIKITYSSKHDMWINNKYDIALDLQVVRRTKPQALYTGSICTHLISKNKKEVKMFCDGARAVGQIISQYKLEDE